MHPTRTINARFHSARRIGTETGAGVNQLLCFAFLLFVARAPRTIAVNGIAIFFCLVCCADKAARSDSPMSVPPQNDSPQPPAAHRNGLSGRGSRCAGCVCKRPRDKASYIREQDISRGISGCVAGHVEHVAERIRARGEAGYVGQTVRDGQTLFEPGGGVGWHGPR